MFHTNRIENEYFEKEEDFYSPETRERLIEDDELSAKEDGIMKGYAEGIEEEEEEEYTDEEEDWESWEPYEKEIPYWN